MARIKVITNHWNGSTDVLRLNPANEIFSWEVGQWLDPSYAKSLDIHHEPPEEEWPAKGMLEL